MIVTSGFMTQVLFLSNEGVTFKAGAAGAEGTDSNPAPLFVGLNSNNLLLHANIDDTTLQLYDSTTNTKLVDIAVASGTNTDFGKKTLGEIAKSAAGYDPTHKMDLRFSGGATLASDKTVFGSLEFACTTSCC